MLLVSFLRLASVALPLPSSNRNVPNSGVDDNRSDGDANANGNNGGWRCRCNFLSESIYAIHLTY